VGKKILKEEDLPSKVGRGVDVGKAEEAPVISKREVKEENVTRRTRGIQGEEVLVPGCD
jgi:hypothetical protein